MASIAGNIARAEDRALCRARFAACRAQSEALAQHLSPEDQVVQSMPDASPTKWHLAHLSWFFETFILAPHASGYRLFDPAFNHLFNSYYEAAGPRHPRPARGLISRPGIAEILRYRAHVTEALLDFIDGAGASAWHAAAPLIELGINHEEQHQELILMDIKHLLSLNPLQPAYAAPAPRAPRAKSKKLDWVAFKGGLVEIGHDNADFAFDNEAPRHKAWLEPFALASRLVTNGEYRAFIEDGGYARPEFWLADGWAAVQANGWRAPLYWRDGDGSRTEFTLAGLQPLDPFAPVCHVSHFEADAFAAWAGRRLPGESEWEHAAAALPVAGNFLDSGALAPLPAPGEGRLEQMFGDVWEWTRSAYAPYPGFRPAPGAVSEYNGKFMSGQMVLRGGCCVTPPGHARATYRNFFYPASRWCFGGIRLAEDA